MADSQDPLAAPDQALSAYLQALLGEVPHNAGVTLIEPPPPVLWRPTLLPATLAIAPAPPAPTVAPVAVAVPPDWAAAPFPVLQFTAAGRQFALPLVCLTRIEPLRGNLTRLPGLPAWCLGLFLLRGSKVGVVDLPQWLSPGREPTPADYLLILDGGRWALTCESLGEVARVDPEQVRWRRVPGQTALVCGVLPDSLTPLLSTADILARLTDKSPDKRTTLLINEAN